MFRCEQCGKVGAAKEKPVRIVVATKMVINVETGRPSRQIARELVVHATCVGREGTMNGGRP